MVLAVLHSSLNVSIPMYEVLKIAITQGAKPFLNKTYMSVRRGKNGACDTAEYNF